jgi:thiamine-monophosphate kinase
MSKSEFELIDWIQEHSQLPHEDVQLGIGDDMAVMAIGGEKLLITTDMLLEGVHFDLNRCSLEQVGYKAMACSLSDCAAMAAVPFVAVVAVALPNQMSMEQAQQLHSGLQQAAEQYHCPLVGGDTTSWDKPLAINVTMLARAREKGPVFRGGAKCGDVIMITGALGGSLEGRHLSFTPRVTEALALAKMVDLHAMIDISDGLSSDLNHICTQSKVSAKIYEDKIPIHSAAMAKPDPLSSALHDGEDFELLFCLSQADAEKLQQNWSQYSQTPLSVIGTIEPWDEKAESPISLVKQDGSIVKIPARGWEHFHE